MMKIIMSQPNVLDDSLRVKGTREDEFKDAVEAMDSITEFRTIEPHETNIISFEANKPMKGVFTVRTLIPDRFDSGDILPRPVNTTSGKKVAVGYFGPSAGNTRYMSEAAMLNAGFTEAQIAEVKKTGFCIGVDDGMGDGEEMFLLFGQLLPTFCRYVGIETVSDEPSLFRDMYLASRMREVTKPCGMVYRTVDGVMKAFAFVGMSFRPVPQSALIKCAELCIDGREYEVMGWSIDHKVTEIDYRLKAPVARRSNHVFRIGFHMVTSDIGDASFRITPTLWCDRAMVTTPFVADAPHNDHFDVNDVVSRVVEYEAKARAMVADMLKVVDGYTVPNRRKASEEIAKALGLYASDSVGKKRMKNVMSGSGIPEDGCPLMDVVLWTLSISKEAFDEISFSSKERLLKSLGRVYDTSLWIGAVTKEVKK